MTPYPESATLHPHDIHAQVAADEIHTRRVWVPNESDVYTPAEWAELQALARELGWRELGGRDV